MIILSTLNAKYAHASLGLRYLYANMQELQSQTMLIERTIHEEPLRFVEELLALRPSVVAFGVYIWNVTQIQKLLALIKQIAPEVITVVGGPEVSFEPINLALKDVDYVIQGEADTAFYSLCKRLLSSAIEHQSGAKIIASQRPDLHALALPYQYYSDEDIANRYIYIESSRGCPFLCEFCLSSLDQKLRRFEDGAFYEALESLWQRGARTFKFVDRTFNVQISHATKLLDFFLHKSPPYHLHFEVIPDQFPALLRQKIAQFPPHVLQLEIGIQTLSEKTSALISRPLNREKMQQNIQFLQQHGIHLHLDIIIGLPSEQIGDIASHLNALVALGHCEIQVGILKRLSGTAIVRHSKEYGLLFTDEAPYEVLKTSTISFAQMMQLKRFARYWDIYYNSGNFTKTMALLFSQHAFENFFDFSDWLYRQINRTHKISLENQMNYLAIYLHQYAGLGKEDITNALTSDCKRKPQLINQLIYHENDITISNNITRNNHLKRQKRKIDQDF